MRDTHLSAARWTALLLPLALLAGALGSQYLGGLFPCEMCHWQRWPHYAAVVVAASSFLTRRPGVQRPLVALAAVLIALSGAIGVFHAGVEYHWWQGITACSMTVNAGAQGDFLKNLLAAPVVRCDVAQWRFLGISLAGYNAIFSLGGAFTIFVLLARRSR
ncbi:disulfide bond formation protein B [Stakelama saccharophila]|uniref:Disulfide bond formation protein B n=1 Tax=Stakelama saccharophila TaxID=3075605 RepID=A0ABZ0BAU3_9SPHN|nr:disulfide bond formation protein B [Stakelama sp. W311]WNO53801.1 disulfide bond formation protein B [Stakelama sp. W311]